MGVRLAAGTWARRYGLDLAALYRRLDLGWTVADAITTPPRPGEQRDLAVAALADIKPRLRYGNLNADNRAAAAARWSALLGMSIPAA